MTELQVGPVLADKGGQGAVLAGAHHQRCGAAHETAQVAAGDQGAILARTTTTTSFFNSQSSVITFVNFITRTTTTTTSCSSTSDASGVVESLSKVLLTLGETLCLRRSHVTVDALLQGAFSITLFTTTTTTVMVAIFRILLSTASR